MGWLWFSSGVIQGKLCNKALKEMELRHAISNEEFLLLIFIGSHLLANIYIFFFFQRPQATDIALFLFTAITPLCAIVFFSLFTFLFRFLNSKYFTCHFWQKVTVLKEEIPQAWIKLLERHIQDGAATERFFFFLSSPCVVYQSSYWLNEHRKKHVFFLGPESKCGLGVQGLLPVQSARVVGPTSCQLSFSSCVPGPINCILHSPVISPGGNLVLMAYKMGGTGPYGNTLCCRVSSVALHKGP